MHPTPNSEKARRSIGRIRSHTGRTQAKEFVMLSTVIDNVFQYGFAILKALFEL